MASWQELETGVTNHDAAAWAPHIAEEFAMLSSANDHPLTKADRIATLNLQKQTGRGTAPAPLVSAQMFDFGDSVIMTCMQDRKSTRLNSSHGYISYAVFCLKKNKTQALVDSADPRAG